MSVPRAEHVPPLIFFTDDPMAQTQFGGIVGTRRPRRNSCVSGVLNVRHIRSDPPPSSRFHRYGRSDCPESSFSRPATSSCACAATCARGPTSAHVLRFYPMSVCSGPGVRVIRLVNPGPSWRFTRTVPSTIGRGTQRLPRSGQRRSRKSCSDG